MEIQLFNFENNLPVRTVIIGADVWFVANDIAGILGYINTRDAINKHCNPKGVANRDTLTKGGNQNMVYINEPNVYRLITRSKLKSCEKFEEWLFEEVVPSIRKTGQYGYKIDRSTMPNFINRYQDNLHRINRKYFSVISELFLTLYAEFEKVGYIIPNTGEHGKDMYPDISVGITFSNYLKRTKSEFYEKHKFYKHSFLDSRDDVDARMYPIEAVPVFRNFIYDEWLPKYAHKYFTERDKLALEYLPKLIS